MNMTNAFESSEKNAVEFLSQMRLGDITKLATTQYLRENKTPDDLIKIIGDFFQESRLVTTAYWKQTEHLEDRRDRIPLFSAESKELAEKVLKGENVKIVSPHRLKGDEQQRVVKDASNKQKGIPLEYRSIGQLTGSPFTDPDGLKEVAWRVIDEVRELNTKHLDRKTRKALLKSANK